jgi:hypothetical protein
MLLGLTITCERGIIEAARTRTFPSNGVRMFEYEIDRWGNYKRLTIEQPVRCIDNTLAEFQQQLVDQNLLREAFPPRRLHVTLFRISRPSNLLIAIKPYNPDLELITLLSHLQAVLNKAKMVKERDFQTGELRPFGHPSSPVAALVIEADGKWFHDARHPLIKAMEDCLSDCGVPDPSGFMHTDPDLRYNHGDTFLPHLSLGPMLPGKQVPDFRIPQFAVKLGPACIRGAVPLIANL